MMKEKIKEYFKTLAKLPLSAQVTDSNQREIPLEKAFSAMIGNLRAVTNSTGKIMFIGNGGSAGIASHCAIDYSKNGNMRSLAFNDTAAITCLGNDLGYEKVFSNQISMHAMEGDILIAISSSGKSKNILNAVTMALTRKCTVYTFSGFNKKNPLRQMGHMNFYIKSKEYGFVEISHLSLLHAVLDLSMGKI